jgi:hypothetical protein
MINQWYYSKGNRSENYLFIIVYSRKQKIARYFSFQPMLYLKWFKSKIHYFLQLKILIKIKDLSIKQFKKMYKVK